MIFVLCAAALGGGCRSVVVQRQVVQKSVAVPVTPFFVAYPVQGYRDTDGQLRLRRTEDAIKQLLDVQRQNAELLRLLAVKEGLGPMLLSAKAQAAQGVVRRSCAECHSGTAPKGGLDLSELSQLGVREKMAVEAALATEQMPPEGRPKLSTEDYQKVREWVYEDAKGIREWLRNPAPGLPQPEKGGRK